MRKLRPTTTDSKEVWDAIEMLGKEVLDKKGLPTGSDDKVRLLEQENVLLRTLYYHCQAQHPTGITVLNLL